MRSKGYTLFDVSGPHPIPVEKLVRANQVRRGCPEFWARYPDLKDKRGCYLFAMRAGRGFVPVYVGKATKSFGQECFSLHKTGTHYNRALADRQRGTPTMFFLVAQQKRGRTNSKSIEDLETTLIRWAREKNHELSNKAKRGVYTWGINGVEGGKPGKPTRDAATFRKVIGYD
jgi:hypothetical protein